MDGVAQHDPEMISQMLYKLAEEDPQVVGAV